MAPPRKPWFRFYVEAIDDDKLVRHPPEICWLWTTIMALARKSVMPGFLLISEGTPHTVDTIAGKSRVPAKRVRQALVEFEKDSMLAWDKELGCWVVSNFQRRQFESDNVTERTAKHRSKERRWNVPSSTDGTTRPLLAENREQNSDPANGCADTHAQQTSPAAAAPPVDQAIGILVDRRIHAGGDRIGNPGGYRTVMHPKLRDQHAEAIASLPDLAWTPESLADWLEPAGPPPRPPSPPQPHPADGCPHCEGRGTVYDETTDTVTRCQHQVPAQ